MHEHAPAINPACTHTHTHARARACIVSRRKRSRESSCPDLTAPALVSGDSGPNAEQGEGETLQVPISSVPGYLLGHSYPELLECRWAASMLANEECTQCLQKKGVQIGNLDACRTAWGSKRLLLSWTASPRAHFLTYCITGQIRHMHQQMQPYFMCRLHHWSGPARASSIATI
eukprot:1147618-Pelagomonas_calceolata.AAC.1